MIFAMLLIKQTLHFQLSFLQHIDLQQFIAITPTLNFLKLWRGNWYFLLILPNQSLSWQTLNRYLQKKHSLTNFLTTLKSVRTIIAISQIFGQFFDLIRYSIAYGLTIYLMQECEKNSAIFIHFLNLIKSWNHVRLEVRFILLSIT